MRFSGKYFPRRAGAIAVVLLLIVAIFFFSPLGTRLSVGWYERAMLAVSPDAARAFEYGNRHFDAKHPALYDIDLAAHFFKKAEGLDSTYTYLNHQIARVEFLRGNFNTALYYINREIELHGTATPNSYYVRGLIEGYMGRYDDAVRDYAEYLKHDPSNWAALNDYAWVLLKAERFSDALDAADRGLSFVPENPWLLNSRAIALYELRRYEEALDAVKRASASIGSVTERDWLTAYPGNDPRIAGEGIATLKKSIDDNMHMIELAQASGTVE